MQETLNSPRRANGWSCIFQQWHLRPSGVLRGLSQGGKA